jgi:hypothetical protein
MTRNWSNAMKLRMLAGVAAVAATAVVPMVAQAQNSDPNAKATFDGSIHKKGTTGKLQVTYQCASGEALWVSAKQSKSGGINPALKKEGASKIAHTWLQSHRNKFVCDGTPHTAKFKIDKVEPGSKGKLKKGRAWVQFCVTKGEQDLILSASGWVPVTT